MTHYLRHWREARGLSTAALAAKLAVEEPMLSLYETGARGISINIMLRMCATLDITPGEFFFGPGWRVT